jgi:hypothetical protein
VPSVYDTFSTVSPVGALFSVKFEASSVSSTKVVPESVTVRLLVSRFSSVSAVDGVTEAEIASVVKLTTEP